MSKERELLQRILDTDPKFLGGRFIAEIQELLAQPEQEQEPVAWMYDWYEGDTESTSTYCGSEKPFQEDEVKPFNLRPLYEHPKREPLTPQQISEGNQSMLNATRETFIAGVRFAEVMHGITGGGE